jgi:hypothetical protein
MSETEWFLSPTGKMYRGKKSILKVSLLLQDIHMYLSEQFKFNSDKSITKDG